ncbi:MAG: hypothetical protein QW639_05460 [Candidatus Bathyarchaeia archaeon]
MKFTIIHENWNEYTIKDEKPVPMRGRIIVTKVFKTDKYDARGNPLYIYGSQNIFVTFAPPELKGTPSERIPTDEERLELIIRDLEFETNREVWNEYELEDGSILRVKLVVSAVQKTSVFTQDGDPLYNVQSSAVMGVIVPPELRRKPSRPGDLVV